MSDKAYLYVNSNGWGVNRHSYSASETFRECPRKYYLGKVQGWKEKTDNAAKHFGIALEHAITFYHRRAAAVDNAVKEFELAWAEHKDKPYSYAKTDTDWATLNETGKELVRLYHVLYPNLPYTVPNPEQAFQVETNFEVFPGTKLAGIEFTSFIDMVGQIKDSFEPIIIDMKTSGKDIPEMISLDPQLRSYSWVKDWRNVAFLWFKKCGRKMSKGDEVTVLHECKAGRPGEKLIVLKADDFGVWVTPNQRVVDEIDSLFKGKSKETEAARAKYIETNAEHVPEHYLTKQQIQFGSGVVSKESADDIGRAIKKDIIDICGATEQDFFPMLSGVRWPKDQCLNCCMRGICSGNNELRDKIIVRKTKDDVVDFGTESE